MGTEKLRLEHRDILRERLRNINSSISDYSFANIYLFRDVHKYEVIIDNEIFIAGITYSGFKYIMPVFDVRQADIGYITSMMNGFDFLFPVPEEWISMFSEGDFNVSCDESDTDYVFTLEKISTYRGKKLHGKRNLLRQFMDRYNHDAVPLTSDRINDAVTVLENWQRSTGEPPENTDYYPCLEALRLLDDLLLCGGIYYVEGKPAGFILGEEIRDDMFAFHFAKADRQVKGIYQFMYNNCARVLPDKYSYINFEQDLGRNDLRLAKSSYVPDMMVKKYRVSIK
jgi:uncharacterized protein